MKRGIRKPIAITVMIIAMLLCTITATSAEYVSSDYGALQNIRVDVKNQISTSMQDGYAFTHPQSAYVGSYVSATFYWVNQKTDELGTTYRWDGRNGNADVSAPTLTGHIRYYKVISHHTASYGNSQLSFNLTTYAP